MASLTKRQRQVIALVSQGKTNTEIGREIGCRADSVKNHIYNIHQRIGTNGSRAKLAAWWMEQQQQEALDTEYARGFRHGYVDGLAAGRTGDRRVAPALKMAQ
jgi:DNA-binding CsgD family transcriptional regulator